jgi:mevalonate kinase
MRAWLLFGVSETVIAFFSQTQIIPDNLLNILIQLPLVAVIIWRDERSKQWLEHMLDVQRVSLKEIYSSRDALLETLLKHIGDEQSKTIDKLDKIENQMRINSGLLAEVAKMDDLVEKLMDKIDRAKSK